MSEISELLAGLGATHDEIETATRNGTLLALAAERFLLPGERRFDVADVAAQSGLDPASLDRLLLALGFPRAAEGEKLLTDRDVEIFNTMLIGGRALTDNLLHETRVISSALARIAEVLVDELWDDHSAGAAAEPSIIEGAYDFERVEGLMLYLLRQHIVAAIYRRTSLTERFARSGTSSVAVGFADVVDFTSLSGSLNDADLTRLVVRFEKTTFDLIAEMRGRVVKTIGDEVMFTFDEAANAADFSLRLTEAEGTELPPVRVGLGWGPVVARQGDCFGPTVNLASRLAGVAGGGEVVVESAMAAELAGDRRMKTTPLGARDLKGFGAVQLWRLERAGG